MRIAIFGARGVPAKWGGFDTFVTELGPRLVDKGHSVTVFCQPKYIDEENYNNYKGVDIVVLPTIYGKFTETVIHEFLSSIYSLFHKKYDIYYVLGCRSTWVYLLYFLLNRTLVINTDGLDWKRRKWGAFSTLYLKANYWLARKISKYLVSDSKELKKLYLEWYEKDTAFLTNGAKILFNGDEKILREYDLTAKEYYLIACRIEPENNIDIIVNEFVKSDSKSTLAIAGGANYKSNYFAKLKEINDPRVKFLGPVYADGHIETLHLYSKAYIHGHEVGGTNPSLLKAMGCGNIIMAHDVRFNREVLGGTGFLWSKSENDLRDLINDIDKKTEKIRDEESKKCRDRITEYYTWDKVAKDHEKYFKWVLGNETSYLDSF